MKAGPSVPMSLLSRCFVFDPATTNSTRPFQLVNNGLSLSSSSHNYQHNDTLTTPEEDYDKDNDKLIRGGFFGMYFLDTSFGWGSAVVDRVNLFQ